MKRLAWHIGDNLRWLADNPGAPRLPCGWLHGAFLIAVADKFAASGMEARQGGDVEQAPSRSDDSPPGRPNSIGNGEKI